MELPDKGGGRREADLHTDFRHGKVLIEKEYAGPFDAHCLDVFKRGNTQDIAGRMTLMRIVASDETEAVRSVSRMSRRKKA